MVSPLSVLSNWKREIEKWSAINSYVYRGTQRAAEFLRWKKHGGILLTNFEQINHLLKSGEKLNVDFLIVDEAHYIKNPETIRSKNIDKIAKKAEYTLFMTGTPLENRLNEMQRLISVLKPTLARRISRSSVEYNPENFKRVISLVYLRRKRDDVLKELPDIETVELWSRFSEVEQDYYDEAVSLGAAGLMKMRRAGFYGESPKDSEKMKQLIDICNEAKENGHKVLIFSYFKIVLRAIQEQTSDMTVDMISGEVSTNRRQEIIDEFTKADSGSVLLSQIEAGGVGLNIQTANIVILCEPQWKPSTENQAISRVYRMGQTRNVIVYKLLTEESIDETMLEILGTKIKLFTAYAHDSVVSDAFDQKQMILPEEAVKSKVLEIEKERLKRASENIMNSDTSKKFKSLYKHKCD